jgi:hypothetical protein
MIYYTHGTKEIIRANSPKDAWKNADKGIVSWIKWVK